MQKTSVFGFDKFLQLGGKKKDWKMYKPVLDWYTG
jgi:hypothetical protein